MIVKLLFSMLTLLSIHGAAHSQGIWEDLRRPRSTVPAPPAQHVSPEQKCAEMKDRESAFKCRGFYKREGFTVAWFGRQPFVDHGMVVEILARGTEAVACFNERYELDEFSPCMRLYAPSKLPH